MDGNAVGYLAETSSPGSSTTIASYSTANHNFLQGWVCGSATSGKDVLSLEFCSGSGSGGSGLLSNSSNALSAVRYSNCVFANNISFGVNHFASGVVETRGNNTITGNLAGPTSGVIGTFPPM